MEAFVRVSPRDRVMCLFPAMCRATWSQWRLFRSPDSVLSYRRHFSDRFLLSLKGRNHLELKKWSSEIKIKRSVGWWLFTQSSTYVFFQQIVIQWLLCIKHCSALWGERNELNNFSFCSRGIKVQWNKTHIHLPPLIAMLSCVWIFIWFSTKTGKEVSWWATCGNASFGKTYHVCSLPEPKEVISVKTEDIG